MRSERFEMRLTPELLAQIDSARGDVSRSRWIERMLLEALDVRPVIREASEGPTEIKVEAGSTELRYQGVDPEVLAQETPHEKPTMVCRDCGTVISSPAQMKTGRCRCMGRLVPA